MRANKKQSPIPHNQGHPAVRNIPAWLGQALAQGKSAILTIIIMYTATGLKMLAS